MNGIFELLDQKNYNALKKELAEMNIVDIAETFEEIHQKKEIIILFGLIPKDKAAEVFSYLPFEKQQLLTQSFTDSKIAEILDELYIDDFVDFLEELPANAVERILKNTRPEIREAINRILKYPDNSAGSIMTIEFLDVKSNMTVEKAFSRIRNIGTDKETINTIYVTDEHKVLKGVVSIRNLIMSSPDMLIKDIMTENVIFAHTLQDQEEVAEIFRKYDFNSLPVADNENRLVGIITIDDIIDIMQEETTEDIQKMSAISPTENTYLKTSVFTHVKKRIGWLLFLMVSSIFTGLIIDSFEKAILVVPALVGFIPMIMSTGGNSGSQTSTLMIRGMAVGELSIKDAKKVFLKEFCVALIIGLILGLVNFFRIWIFNHSIRLGITVCTALYLTVILAKLIGFILPMLARAIKLDPALMSAPLISTILDSLSIVTFFLIASLVFGI